VTTTIGESLDLSEAQKRLAIRGECYNELRAYRERELHTFLFAFPLIGVAFLPTFEAALYFVVLVTGFFLVVANYILRNHRRMLSIKREIVAQQDALGLTPLYRELDPQKMDIEAFGGAPRNDDVSILAFHRGVAGVVHQGA
jgi:hypothetical protein